jgi:hypothetical protein
MLDANCEADVATIRKHKQFSWRCMRLTTACAKAPAAWRCSPRPALIARIVFDIDICKGLPETVPATDSRRKSRGHLRPRSGRIPRPCGIGSSSTRHRLRFLRRPKAHHHKLGWTRFRTTLPPQEATILNVSFARVFATTIPPSFPASSKINTAEGTNTAPAYLVFRKKPSSFAMFAAIPSRLAVSPTGRGN